jgi:hypothetical protein
MALLIIGGVLKFEDNFWGHFFYLGYYYIF